MRNGTAVAVIAAAAALVGLLTYGVMSKGADASIDSALRRGERVDPPTAQLPVLGQDGRTASLEDFRGKVVVLNFWASWCPPCVEELPLLQRTQERIEGRGATVLGIDVEDAQSKALEFVEQYDLTFPSLRDPDRGYAQAFGIVGYPETFVLDRTGRIAAARRGPVDQEWLDRTLPPLLEEDA